MPDFVNSEYNVEKLFPTGSVFSFEGKEYTVEISGKPRPSSGECKTDVYVKGVSDDGEVKELKISVKQRNADFLENKIALERAIEIFGENAQDIIKRSTISIKDSFLNDSLVYFESYGRTQRHSMKLGWKFELMNKLSGDKSGVIELTNEQKHDIFAGINLPEDKKHSKVNEQVIQNSGVANYILFVDDDNLTLENCLKNLLPIREYAESQTIYFACKALNYRFDDRKWDGPRPLSVYVDWFVKNGLLNARLVFDSPLEHKGTEIGTKLLNALDELNIKEFDDLRRVLSPDIKCYP